jgi:hypothetical protein
MRERFADALVACMAVAKTESIRSLVVIVSFGSLYFSRLLFGDFSFNKGDPTYRYARKGISDSVGARKKEKRSD